MLLEYIAPPKARARLLIADDEIFITKTLDAILTNAGFEVMAVNGGQAAVQIAPEWHPDLFLSDVMMPDLNGIEAAIQIIHRLPNCKVLLISGHAVVENLASNARERGHDFPILMKPIHPVDLIERINATLEGSDSSDTPISSQ